MTQMIVMLIWIGSGYGGPATLQGFTSLAACEVSRSRVEETYKKMGSYWTYTTCISLPNGDE